MSSRTPDGSLDISLQGTSLTYEPFTLTQGDTPSVNLVKYQMYGANHSLALTYKIQTTPFKLDCPPAAISASVFLRVARRRRRENKKFS
jgi:hypothetical protein